MKITSDITEWLYSNLDLIEECKEKKLKPIILIGGASSSGKSYTSKLLKNFLQEKGYKPIVLSTDNYNKGIAENIFDIVNKKYYGNNLKNKKQVVKEIKKIIITSDFELKFCKNNLKQIKNKCKNMLDINLENFAKHLQYEFEHINFDSKSIYNLTEVADDISRLVNNQQITEKKYSKMISERIEQDNISDGKNFDIVLVEGIYALTKNITKHFEGGNIIKNFVDCNDKNLFLRRMIRDSSITNCPKGFILKNYLDYVAPEYYGNVLKTKINADIVLNNNMTFEELRKGKIDIQNKYQISLKEFNQLLKQSTSHKKMFVIDTYFGKPDDQNVLRLRETKLKNSEYKMESLIYKGKPKVRKDNSLIRPNFELANQKELCDTFESKNELVKKLSDAKIKVFKTVKKLRWILDYKNSKIKVDILPNKIILETSEKLENLIKINEKNDIEKEVLL